jgi:hypothetical protein
MSNRLKMAIAHAISQLHSLHRSHRRIARKLGIDRRTVRRHLLPRVRWAKCHPFAHPKCTTLEGLAGCGAGDAKNVDRPNNASIPVVPRAPGQAPPRAADLPGPRLRITTLNRLRRRQAVRAETGADADLAHAADRMPTRSRSSSRLRHRSVPMASVARRRSSAPCCRTPARHIARPRSARRRRTSSVAGENALWHFGGVTEPS